MVAAKTILHTYPSQFAVTILERKNTVGGLWPTEPDHYDGMLSPEMPTNLSKYTVGFSDLAWTSVDLSIDSTSSLNGEGQKHKAGKRTQEAPMFPKAWHVGRYLQTYARKYIGKAAIRTNSTVESAMRERCRDGHRWKVAWTCPTVELQDGIGSAATGNESRQDHHSYQQSSGVFDFLIVASGFFGTPKIPALPGLDTFPGTLIHSTELGKLKGLRKNILTSPTKHPATRSKHDGGTGNTLNIVVVGGGMSGAEAAASLAFQASTQRYSSRETPGDKTDHQIYHVTSRPFYALPTYTPIDPTQATKPTCDGSVLDSWNDAPCFAPLDLCMYNLTRRRPGLISDYTGAMTAAQSRLTHKYLSGLVGGNQLDLGQAQALHVTNKYQDRPPRVVISDGYSEFVRSGAVTTVFGSVASLGVGQSGVGSVKISCVSDERVLEDVTAVVMATGFTPQASLDWLPKEILETLQYDGIHDRIPVVLQHGSYCHPKISNLGFVGFYEGPYWGIMEMQARLLVRNWASCTDRDTSNVSTDTHAKESQSQQMLALRLALKDEPESFSQFWMGDYVGFMESFARDLQIARAELEGFEERGGPLVPARYPYTHNDATEITKGLMHLGSTLQGISAGVEFVAKATFRAMQGAWNIRRDLKSAIPTYPSGKFAGVANFHPRQPTDELYDGEYLYVEDGELVTDTGMSMRGSRRYVYRYQEEADALTAWFVKPWDGKSVDYFFHELQFHVSDRELKSTSPEEKGWSATSHHLCVPDDYHVTYLFQFRGATLGRFKIRYQVEGPKKDYVSEAWYERPEHEPRIETV